MKFLMGALGLLLLLGAGAVSAPTNVTVLEVLPFRYTTNRFHDIQRSTNLVDWETVLKNCYGPPSTNADLYVVSTNRAELWRAVGHPNFDP